MSCPPPPRNQLPTLRDEAAAPAAADSLSLSLPPPENHLRNDHRTSQPLPSMATLLGSLGIVLGLFLLVAWIVRWGMPKGAAALPREAVEVLGRTQLTGRQYVHLVRCGNKMLLVSVTAGGAETLTEITDPAEVDRLAGLCFQTRSGSATANFRQLMNNFANESPRGRRRATDRSRF